MACHVNVGAGDAGGPESALHHGLGAAEEGVDGPVGAGPRLHVLQRAALRLPDGRPYGLHHLGTTPLREVGHALHYLLPGGHVVDTGNNY